MNQPANPAHLVPPDARKHETPASPGCPRYRRANRALFIAGFASFALLYCVQPLLPVFSQAFGQSAASSSLILSIATFSMALGLLVTGPLSDAVGQSVAFAEDCLEVRIRGEDVLGRFERLRLVPPR